MRGLCSACETQHCISAQMSFAVRFSYQQTCDKGTFVPSQQMSSDLLRATAHMPEHQALQ